jgi:DNA-binding MarR family transcriptional regulator
VVDSVTKQVVQALRRIIRAVDLHSRALVARYGLTGPQLTIMKALEAVNGLWVGKLAEQVHLSQATVTGILDRLAKAGLIVRRRDGQDKRRVTAELTPEGRRVLARTPPPLQEHFMERFSRLADWEQNQILSSLQRIVAMMEACDLEAAPMLATGPIDVTPERTQAFLGLQRPGEEQLAAEVPSAGSAASKPVDRQA